MIQSAGGSRLLLEAPPPGVIPAQLLGQDFERDLAPEPRIEGPIDLTHSASAEGRENFVGAKSVADCERHAFERSYRNYPRSDRANRHVRYLFLFIGTESGIAKAHGLVILHKLRYRTHHLPDVKIVRQPLKWKLVERHPGFRIHLRVVDDHGQLQQILIDAMESLFYAEILAMRTAAFVEPCSFIRAVGLGHKRVIVHPFARRVAEPPRFRRIFGEVSPVRPDAPPYFGKFVQDHHLFGGLQDLSGSEFVEVLTRHSHGVAVDDRRVINLTRNILSGSISGPIVFHLFPRQSGVGQLMFRLAVFGHISRTCSLDSVALAPGWGPSPRDVMARSWGRLSLGKRQAYDQRRNHSKCPRR